MIICNSIIDKHTGKHIGMYAFEIDYPADSHFDILVAVAPPETEDEVRRFVGRLWSKEELEDDEGGVVQLPCGGEGCQDAGSGREHWQDRGSETYERGDADFAVTGHGPAG